MFMLKEQLEAETLIMCAQQLEIATNNEAIVQTLENSRNELAAAQEEQSVSNQHHYMTTCRATSYALHLMR
jgi:hypothetical protein